MAKFKYMLAPIEDMTSNAFRTLCHRQGADLTFTELTRVEGLAKKNKATWSRLSFNDKTPTVIQLLGANEQHFKKFLSMFSPHPGFKGFNLNLGCPSPQVIRLGQGAAMIRRIAKTKKVIKIFRDAGYPISIKMRLGITRIDREHKSYLNLLRAVDADFFVIHARYGQQTYQEPADFSVYEECVRTGRNIIANGDITDKEKVNLVKDAGVKGVMIGRGAIYDPRIFRRLKDLPGKTPSLEDLKKEFLNLTEKYKEPFKYRKNITKIMGNKSFSMPNG
ncbi:tRNA-dihydrouridine synthase family protein [Candidatus Woesearchaeota archaeon]|nr:tRNA-dihydrouridine synthase family protein [Candidatus Woesearchaeota archaeon]MBW3014571.1 tRNA-dihydrouridine synthase family protein [Candidatus Woesearchaeota archaeon]